MLFNILVGVAFLFIVAFLLIKPEAKKEDFERKAEFVVVMEWDHDQPDDIDLYVQDPTRTKVHFRLPITNFMYLDKDDLGYANDIVKNIDGTITKVNINREVVTIRGIIPGEYIINAHYYSSRNWTGQDTFRNTADIVSKTGKPTKKQLTVKIELHKVNPYKIWWLGEKTFTHKGQEETFVRFTIDQDGKQVGDFTYVEKKFVTPFGNMGVVNPNRNEPTGASSFESGTEESRYHPGDRR
ncbi:hypothetical protein HX849_04160 [Marine Group I thaumarchaeote]|nr:hypothetical protein [Marine Group I thaumarchaeote]